MLVNLALLFPSGLNKAIFAYLSSSLSECGQVPFRIKKRPITF